MTAVEGDVVRQWRAWFGHAGYFPVPIRNGEKRPFLKNWPARARAGEFVDAVPDPENLGTGIECSGLRVVDFDIDDEVVMSKAAAAASEILGAPGWIRFRANSPRCIWIFRAAEGRPPKRLQKGSLGSVEILGAGQQCVLIAAIKGGHDWHDNMLRLVAHWIARGRSDTEILAWAEPLTLAGFTVDATAADMRVMVDGARRKGFDKVATRQEAAASAVGEAAALAAAPSDPPSLANPQQGGRPKHVDLLLAIAGGAELFHDRARTCFADVHVAGHRETWPVRSAGFRRWLTHEFYLAHRGAPNAEALQAGTSVIEARAHFDGPERATFLRVASEAARLYLDLADDTWRAVEIDRDGWRVVNNPPVRFRRAAGMLPIPAPIRGGSLAALGACLNFARSADGLDGLDGESHTLAVAWLLAALRPVGPYPMLVISGEHGSAKTTFLHTLRSIIDPSTSPLRSLPREDRDIFIAASNAHILSYDNVSAMPGWMSDTLCRLSTGGGFATRTLYTDGEETIFDATRPIALNGIEDIVSRPDLADRGLFLTLAAIPEERRRSQSQVHAEIEAQRPAILGALLDAVANGLRRLPETRLTRLPRLADFALWSTACGDGLLWPPGAFMRAFDANRADAIEDAVAGDPVASAIRRLITTDGAWTGTAERLMGDLVRHTGIAPSPRTWPATARAMAGRIRRAAPFLRKVGITVAFTRSTDADRTRLIDIRGPERVGK